MVQYQFLHTMFRKYFVAWILFWKYSHCRIRTYVSKRLKMIKRFYNYIWCKNFLLAGRLFIPLTIPKTNLKKSLISRGVMRIPWYKPHVCMKVLILSDLYEESYIIKFTTGIIKVIHFYIKSRLTAFLILRNYGGLQHILFSNSL